MAWIAEELAEATGPEAAVSEAWPEIEAAIRLHRPDVTADDLQMVEFGCDVLVCRLARLATAQRQA